jgi:hypothetical protein
MRANHEQLSPEESPPLPGWGEPQPVPGAAAPQSPEEAEPLPDGGEPQAERRPGSGDPQAHAS